MIKKTNDKQNDKHRLGDGENMSYCTHTHNTKGRVRDTRRGVKRDVDAERQTVKQEGERKLKTRRRCFDVKEATREETKGRWR